MNPRYRVVIVGCGNIGGLHEDPISSFIYSHGRAFSDHASFEIVGCVDSDLDRAREFSGKYRVKSYGNDIEDLINRTRPHLVSVCTPDATHYEVTKRILAKKKIPEFFAGDVVKVGFRIVEGKRERIQYFMNQ